MMLAVVAASAKMELTQCCLSPGLEEMVDMWHIPDSNPWLTSPGDQIPEVMHLPSRYTSIWQVPLHCYPFLYLTATEH